MATVLALAVAVTGGTTGLAVPPAHPAITAAVSAPSIHPAMAQTVSIATKAVNQQKITTNNLNLRQGKSTGTRVLLTIPKNSRVTVTETSGSWSKTSYKGKTGWVSATYLKNAPASKPPASSTRKTTTHNLNLRQAKSTGTKVLLTIPKNTTVTVSATSGTWSKTSYKGKTDWVASAYLKSAGVAKPPPQSTPKTTRKTTTNNLNLRQSKSTGSKALLTIPKNTTVTISATSGIWSKTSYKGKTGWVASAYLKNTSTAPKTSYRWTTANVNLRKGSSTKHGSLGVVPANQRVTYLKTSNGWSNVKTSKGTGWISNKYLDKNGRHSVVVYGTLRQGQSAHHVLSGRTESVTKTKLANFNMYLKPSQTWWSFIIPSSSSARTVVVERMDIKPGLYRSTLANLDKWERFNPSKPLADQNYNRKLVTDRDGKRSWAYVGASKISNYLVKNGIRVISGDYLKRF